MKRLALTWKQVARKPFRKIVTVAKIWPGEKFEIQGPYGLKMENKGGTPIFLGVDGALVLPRKARKKVKRNA